MKRSDTIAISGDDIVFHLIEEDFYVGRERKAIKKRYGRILRKMGLDAEAVLNSCQNRAWLRHDR